jgi:Sec-independent protein translocase protein TatA
VFLPHRLDKLSGGIAVTGYTELSDEDYRALDETSRTFRHYRDKLKLLVVHDDLPEEAKTPGQALMDAKKAVAALKAENEALKAENTDKKAVKDLRDQIANLTKQLEEAKAGNEKRKADTATGAVGAGTRKEF